MVFTFIHSCRQIFFVFLFIIYIHTIIHKIFIETTSWHPFPTVEGQVLELSHQTWGRSITYQGCVCHLMPTYKCWYV